MGQEGDDQAHARPDDLPAGLVRVVQGEDATTARAYVEELLAAGIPALAKIDGPGEILTARGLDTHAGASVLVPARFEQQATAVLTRGRREGTASDAEIERALLEDDASDRSGRNHPLFTWTGRLLLVLAVACVIFVLAKMLR